MALKDLYKMTKTDRYTADGCEELNKAREADVEDKVYQIGEISQKTGLQKTANGWVKPKSGKGAGAKSESKSSSTKIDTSAAQKKLDELTKNKASFEERNKVAEQIKAADEYNYLVENLEKRSDKPTEEMQKKLVELKTKAEGTESKPAGVTVRQGYKTKQLDETMAEHLTKNLDAYKGYDQGSMEELVLNPSGYELQGTTKSKSGKSSSVYTKGSDKVELFFDKNGELENVKTSASTESKLPATPTRGMSEAYIRGTQLMKPAEDEKQRGEQHWAGVLSGYQDASVIEQRKKLQETYDEFEDDIKDYDRRGLAPAVYAKRINQQNFIKGALKAIDDEMESRGLDPAPNFSRPRDSAPRVLTGDCKIRVKK